MSWFFILKFWKSPSFCNIAWNAESWWYFLQILSSRSRPRVPRDIIPTSILFVAAGIEHCSTGKWWLLMAMSGALSGDQSLMAMLCALCALLLSSLSLALLLPSFCSTRDSGTELPLPTWGPGTTQSASVAWGALQTWALCLVATCAYIPARTGRSPSTSQTMDISSSTMSWRVNSPQVPIVPGESLA